MIAERVINEADVAYIAEIEAWRQAREAGLAAPDSWLALTGLFFLADGVHSVGSAAACDIRLPAGAPAQLGSLDFHDGQAMLHVTTDVPVLADGAPIETVRLTDNRDGAATLVTVGTVTFFIHHVGGQFAVRVRDSRNPAIAAFTGCVWFPVRPEYRVVGRLVRHPAPVDVPIKTVVQTAMTYPSVGWVEFELQGRALRLLARAGGPDQLTFVLRDATAGEETYAQARFLSADLLGDDQVVMDFNKAYNPPCAFTPFATCPLPPPENILPVRIEAGERYPHRS
jgi:uncharacterized protein (DUF1684 family)